MTVEKPIGLQGRAGDPVPPLFNYLNDNRVIGNIIIKGNEIYKIAARAFKAMSKRICFAAKYAEYAGVWPLKTDDSYRGDKLYDGNVEILSA